MWQSESVRRRCSCAQRGWSSSSSSSFSSRQPVRTADFGGQSRLQGLVLFLVRVKIYLWCCVAYQLFASRRVCLFFLLPSIYAFATKRKWHRSRYDTITYSNSMGIYLSIHGICSTLFVPRVYYQLLRRMLADVPIL